MKLVSRRTEGRKRAKEGRKEENGVKEDLEVLDEAARHDVHCKVWVDNALKLSENLLLAREGFRSLWHRDRKRRPGRISVLLPRGDEAVRDGP